MFRKLIISAGVFLSFFSYSAMAATEVFEVRAILRAAIAIIEVDFLNFGTIEIPTGSPTLFTIAASGGAQLNGGNAAEFSVTGEAVQTATVSVTPSVTATVGLTTLTFNLTLSTTSITFPTANIFVGGNVTIPVGADSGNYSDTTATLTILYN